MAPLQDAPYPGYPYADTPQPGSPLSDSLQARLRQAGLLAQGPSAWPGSASGPRPGPGAADDAGRPRLRDLRRDAQPPARAARGERFARWHVPEGNEQESEGWMLPYLDLLTLLLALMVALVGLDRLNADKADADAAQDGPAAVELVGSLAAEGLPGYAFAPLAVPDIPASWARMPGGAVAAGSDAAPAGAASPDAGSPPAEPDDAAAAQPAALLPDEPEPEPVPSVAELGLDQLGKSVEVIVNARSISFRISNELLFPSGQADLRPAGQDVLRRLAEIINRTHYRVSVEGHSDNVPIQTARFPSNWELSTGRATSVLRQLERYGVASKRLSATGYADTHPIASNGSAVGRSANRRVELIMETGARAPLPTADARALEAAGNDAAAEPMPDPAAGTAAAGAGAATATTSASPP